MRSTSFSGLPALLRFAALALVCGACSSDGNDSGAVQATAFGAASPAPVSPNPNSTTPGQSTPGESTPGTPEATPAAPAPTPATTEGTTTPQLAPSQPSDMNAGGDNAMAGAGGTGPTEPPPAMDPAGAPEPSAVCGTGAASPAFNLPNTLFSVPASYDGVTPLPVVLAFHAAGNPNTQLRNILGDTLDDQYIVLYPKSDGNGWTNQADAPKVDAMFAALDALACYDKKRVFATGHSSGAQFIVQRLCAGESRWRAVAPVASSVYCSSWQPIPALVIHGIGDTERQAYGLNDGDGLKDIVPYRTSNGCQESFTEVAVDGCNSGGVQVNPGCRQFNGCSETTQWCQHNDPQYGTSHHGVPCFGARVIKGFFDSFQ